jgi:hypothetical protein
MVFRAAQPAPDDDRHRAAAVLAGFLAEHYYATGQDLADVAAADPAILDLAAGYDRLPALAEQTSELAARDDVSDRTIDRSLVALAQVNKLLNQTAVTIRQRLRALAAAQARSDRYRE